MMKHSFHQRMQAAQQQRAAWYFGHLNRAEQLIKEGQYNAAEDILLDLLSVRPNDSEAQYLLDVTQELMRRT